MATSTWGNSWKTSWTTSWNREVSLLDPYLLYYFGRGRTHDAIAKKKRLRRKGKR